MANTNKKKKHMDEIERNRRIRTNYYLILPLIFIAISIGIVFYVLFNKSNAVYNNALIYASTGLLDAAMFFISWEALCWVFTNDTFWRKFWTAFCWLSFMAGTVYVWTLWNDMATLTGEVNTQIAGLAKTADSTEVQNIAAQISSLSEQRLRLNIDIILLQVSRLFSLCGCLLISWSGTKMKD